jgi:hypothetical protein
MLAWVWHPNLQFAEIARHETQGQESPKSCKHLQEAVAETAGTKRNCKNLPRSEKQLPRSMLVNDAIVPPLRINQAHVPNKSHAAGSNK